MINWDSLQITVLDEDRGVLTETERIYSMQAEQVMVIMSGAAGPAGPRGPKGDKGDAGAPVWGAITGTLSNQTDLQDALDSKPSEAPADDKLYGRQNGVWTQISSAGVVEWGDISGTLSDQTDLQTAINGKLSDAPSDGSEYVRKNGAWAVSGGAGVWGSITGTLSDQTDLQTELDTRLKELSIAEEFDPTKSYPAGWNYVTYKGVFYRFYGPHLGAFEHLTNYEPVYVKTLIDAKANTADLGAMASVSDAPSDGSEYVRKNGAWAVSSGGGGGAPAWGNITGTLADQTDLNTALSGKADASSVYTKTEADALLADKADSADLAGKADASAVYTKTQVDTALSGKADSSAVYSKTEVDTALGAKANSADVTASLATKADASAVYTKSEVDTALGAKANTADLGDLATKDTVDYLTEIDNIPTAFPPEAHTHDDRYYTESEVDTLLNAKQNTLTFDSTPTASSTNPVTSGGVKTAVDEKVSKSGDTMTGKLIIDTGVNYQGIEIEGAEGAPSIHIYNTGNTVLFDLYANGSTGGDRYSLPRSSVKSSDSWYSILTNKTPVTTAQGGTGGTDSGWKSLTNPSVFSGTIYYRKIGCFGAVTGYGLHLASNLTTDALLTLATLPSEYRPSRGFMNAFGSNFISGLIQVESTGPINLYKDRNTSSMTTNMSFYFYYTYLI